MGTLSQAKTFGGVGSILVLLAFIPTVGWVLSVAGLILTLLAVKYIADAVHDNTIFNNALIGYLVSIVGIIVVGVALAAYILSLVGLGAITSGTAGATTGGVVGILTGLIVFLVVVWILLVVSGYFIRKTYYAVSTKLNVSMFQTAGLVFFIGAILTIVLIGFLVLIIAQILLLVAFFSIPDTVPSGPGMPPSPPGSPAMATQPAAPMAGTKYCVKCGASLASDAAFCPNCGASQPPTT
jgi:uncharacterized membrane protein